MDQYNNFGHLYDLEMGDPEMRRTYAKWNSLTRKAIKDNDIYVDTIVDLGCGTGNTTITWPKYGYNVIGIDLSESMLKQAKKKSKEITWKKSNMITYKHKSQVVTCFFDAINHITDKKLVKKMIKNVYNNLDNKGLFMFDFTTINHMKWLSEREKMFIVGNDYFISQNPIKGNKIKYKQTWFLKNGDKYKKQVVEIHEMALDKTFIGKALKEAGFKNIKYETLVTEEGKEFRIMVSAVKK